jgi:ABC-type lipoprotein export system ATPase subunit
LHQEQEITVLLATHDQEMAALADRQIDLRDGSIVAETAVRGD